MPILKKDIDIYPSNLLDTPAKSFSENHRWFALHTKPRQEKVLLRRLLQKRKLFCGLLVPNRSTMPSGRKIMSHSPLFPGYVFLNGTHDDRYGAVCSGSVIQVLEVFDQPRLYSDLQKIHAAISNGSHITRAEAIQKGQEVKIISGPLAGYTGFMLSEKGPCRLLLSLSFIQQGAIVEVDRTNVEVV